MSRPGGNITGFTQFEYVLSVKWLELLKEVAPAVTRAGVIRALAGGPAGIGQWAVIAAAASSLNVELNPINLSVSGMSYACFSFLSRVARELTQGSAERNQFCRRGTKSPRWRKIPTRTM